MDQKESEASKYQMGLSRLYYVKEQARIYGTKKGVYGEVACCDFPKGPGGFLLRHKKSKYLGSIPVIRTQNENSRTPL